MIAEKLQPILLEARPYPAALLDDCESGLAVFSAAFRGWNDVIHFARKGLRTTCVDSNADRLAEMAAIYPADWEFVTSDAWDFAEHAASEDTTWDAITVDPFTDNIQRVLDTLDLFLSLSRKVATFTVKRTSVLPSLEGWEQSLVPRARDISWLVLHRA